MYDDKDREESKIVTTTYATSNSRLKFLIQSLIAVIIVVFSVTQITINPTSENDNSVWVGLICTILGLFFPHPTPMVADVAAGGDGGQLVDDQQREDLTPPRATTTTHTRSRPSPVVAARSSLLAVLPESKPPQLQNETKNT